MTLRNEIGVILKQNGWSITDVAENLYPENKYPSQTLNNKLSNENLKYTEAKQIADIIGCKIQWTPKSIKESIYIDDDISVPITQHTKGVTLEVEEDSPIHRIIEGKFKPDEFKMQNYHIETLKFAIETLAWAEAKNVDQVVLEILNKSIFEMRKRERDFDNLNNQLDRQRRPNKKEPSSE